MKTKTAGLHLWKVGIEYVDGFTKTATLWIITETGNLTEASEKARRFLHTKKGSQQFYHAIVVSVKYRGTIDA